MKMNKILILLTILFLTDSMFSVDEEYRRAVYIAEYYSLLRQDKNIEATSFAEKYFPKHLSEDIKKRGHRNISESDFNTQKETYDIRTVKSNTDPKIQNLAGSEYNNHAQSMKSIVSDYNKLLANGKLQDATTLAEKHFPKAEIDYIKKHGHSQIKEVIIQEEEIKEKKLEYKKVTEVFENETDLLYTLSYEDSTQIQTTWNHPFYIIGKGWTEVKDIKVGDYSKTVTGKLKITNIEIKQLDKPIKVYNMEVEGHHTYYVSDAGILVHNYDQLDINLIEEKKLSENQRKIRMHENLQNIYEEANEMEMNGADSKKVKKLLEEKLRKELEADLPYLTFDRLTEEEKNELRKNNISSEKEYNKHIKNITETRVQTLLKTYDLPVAGRDFFGGKIVKAKGGIDGLQNVTNRVNDRIKEFDDKVSSQFLPGKVATFRKELPQGGNLDFKNLIVKDKETGYTSYVNYNGKILQSPDLANITYGYMMKKHFPNTLGKIEVSKKISNDKNNEDWHRDDPPDDIRAIEYGHYCSNLKNLIPTNSSNCR